MASSHKLQAPFTGQNNMPAVLITWPTVTQNSLFLPQQWLKPSPVLTAPTHEGMARQSWPGWLVTYRGGFPIQDGHPSQF